MRPSGTSSPLRRIGVLGGMGPEATVDFMQRVIRAVDARDDADHIPLIVHNNTQVPSRINAILEGAGDDPSPVLADMARELTAAGAEALVMPCNTAHHYAARIASATPLPFLNMVELAAAHARHVTGGRPLGLLGSPALEKVGVYDPALAAQDIKPIHARTPDRLLATIRSVKAQGPSEIAAHTLSTVAAEMAEDGAAAICVACTEFSLLLKDIGAPVPIFDSLDLLVDAAVRFSRSGDATAQDPTKAMPAVTAGAHVA
ncbi:aspartate/glutamate racemase family protein [Aestuariibius sp. 2305UL40-4]|uniref:aspartate/glutamate racemase family protein n=1 Tax=Aestuariibius violaceus TaxID=3234132 RepID=UPI00345E519F